jgi:ABC-type sugar transport system ATPase subunit
LSEPLGAEIIIDSKIGESMVNSRGSLDFTANIGDKIHLTINKEKMHIFDKATSKAII